MYMKVSIPKRVSEALKLETNFEAHSGTLFFVSIPKRVSEALKLSDLCQSRKDGVVSIPKRVSEALKLIYDANYVQEYLFQSLKGFQRL